MAVTVRIITSDGKIHMNPEEVHIPRNEKYEMFYRILENFKSVKKKDETA